MDGFDCTNIQTTKNLWAGIDPHFVPKHKYQNIMQNEWSHNEPPWSDYGFCILIKLLQRILTEHYLSVMATCSSIAEPVLVFQFPDIDVLLKSVQKVKGTLLSSLLHVRYMNYNCSLLKIASLLKKKPNKKHFIEIEVLSSLWFLIHLEGLSNNVSSYIHVGFVVRTNLLDSDVVLGVDERFCGGVCLCKSHDTGYVLELTVILHLHLYEKENARG